MQEAQAYADEKKFHPPRIPPSGILIHTKNMGAKKYTTWFYQSIYFGDLFFICRYTTPHFLRLLNNIPFYTYLLVS